MTAQADMYFQFPGGGNNRLNEEGRNVANDKRLFDSQNNNRFGHNQAGYYFHSGSEIDLQWTVQHSCGPDSNVNCEVILQYACEDNLRDGERVETIPAERGGCRNNDCNSDKEFGMHEPFEYYQQCALRQRNKRLFPADRHIRGDNARYTRQENNGQRYGYECNEERDYYPYWAPTIWKDIAVFTDNTDRCDYYKQESENVKGRWYCDVPQTFVDEKYSPDSRDAFIPLNATACADLALEYNITTEWKQSKSHDIPAPVCQQAPYQRDNHHGNGEGRQFVGYKWTVPENLQHDQCTFRVRYNISSSDYDGWNTSIDQKIRDDPGCMCRNNYGVDMWSIYGWDGAEGKRRGYRHLNDNAVQIFPNIDMKLRVPYNTDQLGRVFEDRTHKVSFIKPSDEIVADLKTGKRLINLNARGKIGNYVEVYPAFEFDFVPSRLLAKVGDWIHIQWSGSNTNEFHNDGSQVNAHFETENQSRKRDRHNLVEIDDMHSVRPSQELIDAASIFGLSKVDTEKLALDGVFGGDNEYLQAASAYFDLGPRKLTEEGKWVFMSTHNNRFGVRSQKGKVIVLGDN